MAAHARKEIIMRYTVIPTILAVALLGCQHKANVQATVNTPSLQPSNEPTTDDPGRLVRLQRVQQLERIEPMNEPVSSTAQLPGVGGQNLAATPRVPPTAPSYSSGSGSTTKTLTPSSPNGGPTSAGGTYAAAPGKTFGKVVPADAPAAVPGSIKYVIAPRDTLWSLSRQHLGDPKRWTEILAANPGINANGLIVGQTINLPNR